MNKEDSRFPEFAKRFNRASALVGMDKKAQDDLGRLIGVSGPMVNKYRNGRALPGMETAIEICNVFNTNLDWLMRGVGPITSSQSMSLRELWYSFSKEERLSFFADLDSRRDT